jgi:hypothetical protein
MTWGSWGSWGSWDSWGSWSSCGSCSSWSSWSSCISTSVRWACVSEIADSLRSSTWNRAFIVFVTSRINCVKSVVHTDGLISNRVSTGPASIAIRCGVAIIPIFKWCLWSLWSSWASDCIILVFDIDTLTTWNRATCLASELGCVYTESTSVICHRSTGPASIALWFY